ncbi:MAG: hypothetical protein ACREGB_03760, partial [Candidatus Saccharimonadales bacterium]
MDAEKLLQAFTPEETQELAAALPAEIIQAEAVRRGIELSPALGGVALEATATDQEIIEETSEDPEFHITDQIQSAYDGYTTLVNSLN